MRATYQHHWFHLMHRVWSSISSFNEALSICLYVFDIRLIARGTSVTLVLKFSSISCCKDSTTATSFHSLSMRSLLLLLLSKLREKRVQSSNKEIWLASPLSGMFPQEENQSVPHRHQITWEFFINQQIGYS